MVMAVAKVPVQPPPTLIPQPEDPMNDPTCARMRNARFAGASEHVRDWIDQRKKLPSVLKLNKDGRTTAPADSLVVPEKYTKPDQFFFAKEL